MPASLIASGADNGVENILALRGDLVPDVPPKKEFKHASELITFIKETKDYDFGISGACYPEGHLDSRNQVVVFS